MWPCPGYVTALRLQMKVAQIGLKRLDLSSGEQKNKQTKVYITVTGKKIYVNSATNIVTTLLLFFF